jgi:peptide/nickel transport system substrate-binding protein
MAGIVGCSSSTTTTPDTSSTPTAGTAATQTATKYKKDVIIASGLQIITTDPQQLTNVTHNQLFKLLHDRLVNLETETLTIKPELAESWEWTSDTVLELKLRQDVNFQDGTHMTADDVVFTFERAKSGTTVASKMASLEKCEKVDDYTVRMTMVSPNVDWLDTLALPMCSILSKKACEADNLNGPTIGTGAWTIVEYVSGDYTKMKRNDNYWAELPKTETLTLKYIPENSARLIALQNGEIDACIGLNNTELGHVSDDSNLKLIQYKSTTCTYLAFNTTKAPGNNKNLRLALAYAINKDDIIAGATEGYASKATSNWGWSTYGYFDEFTNPIEYNPEKAKEYMALAGYPNGGAKIEFGVVSAERMTAMQIIQEQCKEIGLEIGISEMDSAGLSSLTSFKTAGHEAAIYTLSWNTAGDDCRRPYYKNSNTNKAILTNDHIMKLIDDAVAEFDETKRKPMYKEIQQIVYDEAYYIPLYYSIESLAIDKDLSGIIIEPHQSHDYTYVCVAEQ